MTPLLNKKPRCITKELGERELELHSPLDMSEGIDSRLV